MKIAFAFSGQLRGMHNKERIYALSNRIKELGGHVYASFWDDDVENLEYDLSLFKELFSPIAIEIENHLAWKKSTAEILKCEITTPSGGDDLYPHLKPACLNAHYYSQWYKIWKANMLTKLHNDDYDVVVRIRTDHPFDTDLNFEINDFVNVPHGYILVSHWEGCVGIRDQYAYGSPQTMDYYSALYMYASRYHKEGVYFFPPENMLRHHLSLRNKIVKFWPDLTVAHDIAPPTEAYTQAAKDIASIEFDPQKRFYKQP